MFLIFACSKNNDDLNCNCETEGESSSLNIGNKTLKTTLYKENNNSEYSFYSSNLKDIDEIYNLFDNEQSHLSGLILYTNKPDNVINENDVNGLVTFVKNGSLFEVNIYKKTNKNFEKIDKPNLQSYYISANDLNDLNSLYFNNSKTIISIINFEHVKRPKLIKSEFQKELKKEMSSKGLLRRGGEGCDIPCKSGDGYCYAQESQQRGEKWICGECLKDVVERIKDEKDDQPTTPVNSVGLYSFRDDYLDVHPGGNIYIGIYYGISNDFDYTAIDYSFASTTLDILQQFIPKIEDITQNPNSSNVLLSTSEAETVKTYLNNVKPYLLTQEAKNEVDFLIQKVTEWTGKSNQYITNNLATGYNL